MRPMIDFYKVTQLRLSPVQKINGSDGPFWAREIQIAGEEGAFTMQLFADDPSQITCPSEIASLSLDAVKVAPSGDDPFA